MALPDLGLAEALPDKGSSATQNPAEMSDKEVFGKQPQQTRNSPAAAKIPPPLSAEEFLDSDPKKSNVDEIMETLFGAEAAEALRRDPTTQACRKSKTEMEKYDNCWLQFIRDIYRQHPSDIVELLVAKLRLAEKKRIEGKISREEADVLRAEAHMQFESEVARRTSLARQEVLQRDDREQEQRRSERDLQLREDEYKQERLRRERESQERAKARFDQGLRDTYRPATQTDCSVDAIGLIHCTTR